jgi:hypothetical protein
MQLNGGLNVVAGLGPPTGDPRELSEVLIHRPDAAKPRPMTTNRRR